MPTRPRRRMTKSAVALATAALRAAEEVMPRYGHPCSPRKYTQHQLAAMWVLRQFLKLDDRGLIERPAEWSDLREALGLKELPHYSTLCYAEKRLVKKGALTASWTARFAWPAGKA